MIIEYQPGRKNQVANALGRKAELVELKLEEATAVNPMKWMVPNRIRVGLEKDSIANKLVDLVKEGKTERF